MSAAVTPVLTMDFVSMDTITTPVPANVALKANIVKTVSNLFHFHSFVLI